MKKTSNSIIQQLQVVFSFSILLLFFSLLASYYSTQKLITNSKLVNHTNQVLISAENIISHLKDAETGQRGFLLTGELDFLEPYNGAYALTTESYNELTDLTLDNPIQQKTFGTLKRCMKLSLGKWRSQLIWRGKNNVVSFDPEVRLKEMTKGKKIMDDLRLMVNRVKIEENKMLTDRLDQQQIYISYTPILLVIAALISIAITVFAYLRIKRDMDKRIALQEQEERKYFETARRITAMEGVTKQVADGNYATRSTDEGDDDLGKISAALNTMAVSLEQTFTDLNEKAWLQTGAVNVGDAIRGERVLKNLATKLIAALTDYVSAPIGAIYIIDNDYNFRLAASYGAIEVPDFITAGNGLAGQAVESKKPILLHDLPDGYFNVTSSMGTTSPASMIILPLIFGQECVGVIEIGLLGKPDKLQMAFLENNLESIAIGVNGALDFVRLQNSLKKRRRSRKSCKHSTMNWKT